MQQQRNMKLPLLLDIPIKVLHERYKEESLQYLQKKNIAYKIHHTELVT